MDHEVTDKRAKKAHLEMREGGGSGAAKPSGQTPVTPAPLPTAKGVSRILATRWKIIAIAAVACALLAWVLAAMQPRRYRTSAIAAVAPVAETLSASEVLRGVEVLERRTVVATVAALASTTRVQEASAAGAAGHYDIRATVLPNTNLFRVTVEGPHPARVAEIANRVPQQLSAQTRSMFKYYLVTTVSPAAAPSGAFFPRTGRAVATGLILGLFLGLAAAYGIDRLSATRVT